MEKVKNNGEGTLGFKDDDGESHKLKPKESIECNYKRSMDSRLVIEQIDKKSKKKEVKENGSN